MHLKFMFLNSHTACVSLTLNVRVSNWSQNIYTVENIGNKLGQNIYRVEGNDWQYLRFELLKV